MSDLELEEFFESFREDIEIDFNSNPDNSLSDSFTKKIGEYLEADEEVSDIYWAEYSAHNLEFSGFSYDKERRLLVIIGSQYFSDREIQTLTKEIFIRKFSRLQNFLNAVVGEEPLYKKMAPSDLACGAAREIYDLLIQHREKVKRIKFLIVTNGSLTRNAKEIPLQQFLSRPASFLVFDINRIYKLYTQESTPDAIDIDLKDYACSGLPFLNASLPAHDYKSYLCVMPGELLSKIYDTYGQKLLEQNVRTFLQLRGKVNKSIKNTVENAKESSRFFAYNNGLTCTATEVTVENNLITGLKGLQIVNGGQTTSVIHDSYDNGTDISKILVQMKLSVVENADEYLTFVEKVARSANSQNPVKESDFFSNSRFHKDFKKYSDKIWAPASRGRQTKTKWFYERTRGSYLCKRAEERRKKNEKAFLDTYPKEQFVDKNLIAKTEMIYTGSPFKTKVNQAFSAFVGQITEKLKNDEYAINETYYKQMIAKIIIAQRTDERIKQEERFKEFKSLRVYIKSYALAKLVKCVREKGLHLNFSQIWDCQDLTPELLRAIDFFLDDIYVFLRNQTSQADLRENLAREATWTKYSSTAVSLPEELINQICTDNEEASSETRWARKQKKEDEFCDKMIFVYNLKKEKWGELLEYFNRYPEECLNSERIVLQKMAQGSLKNLSDKHYKILYSLYEKAKKDGFNI